MFNNIIGAFLEFIFKYLMNFDEYVLYMNTNYNINDNGSLLISYSIFVLIAFICIPLFIKFIILPVLKHMNKILKGAH